MYMFVSLFLRDWYSEGQHNFYPFVIAAPFELNQEF